MTDDEKVKFNIALNEFMAVCYELGIAASIAESYDGKLVVEFLILGVEYEG